jgi:integrase
MPVNVQPRGARFQLRVKHKLLQRPFFFTFDSDTDARSYGTQLDALLARGVVPNELLADKPKGEDPLLVEIVRGYTQAGAITDSDDELLTTMLPELVGLRVSSLSFQWADHYVRDLKLVRNMAPGTIRKRVGALGRVVDWHLRRITPLDQLPPANALRLLPRGYSLYTRGEATALEAEGRSSKHDEQRDRRLEPGELADILAALEGERRPDRERALSADPAFRLLFLLILHTGLRLREAYRLRVDQVDLRRGIIRVEGSKGHRGKLKPRTVPLVAELLVELQAWCRGRIGLMFPFWNGTPEDLRPATSRLSVRFGALFDYAGVADVTEHDLRHEATCRWIELRDPRGAWLFSELEICKIMGWSNTNMMLRYASLRGEDLAARLR